jgi:hypothetical protein
MGCTDKVVVKVAGTRLVLNVIYEELQGTLCLLVFMIGLRLAIIDGQPFHLNYYPNETKWQDKYVPV